jgi:hypothetical protein
MTKEIVQYQGILYRKWKTTFIVRMCEILEIKYDRKKLYHWFTNIYDDKIDHKDSRNVFVLRDKNDNNRFVMVDMYREEPAYVTWVIQYNKSEEEKYQPLIAARLKRFSDVALEVIFGKNPEEAEPIYTESSWTDVGRAYGNYYSKMFSRYKANSIEDFLIL